MLAIRHMNCVSYTKNNEKYLKVSGSTQKPEKKIWKHTYKTIVSSFLWAQKKLQAGTPQTTTESLLVGPWSQILIESTMASRDLVQRSTLSGCNFSIHDKVLFFADSKKGSQMVILSRTDTWGYHQQEWRNSRLGNEGLCSPTSRMCIAIQPVIRSANSWVYSPKNNPATQETIRQQKQPASPETVHGVAWIFESSSFFHLIEMLCFPRLRTSCSRNYSAFSENPHISPVSAAFCFCFSFLEWLKKNEEFRIYLSFGELN